MNYQEAADRWLYETIDGATTTAVYNTIIPSNVSGTAVVFQLVTSTDMYVNARIRKGASKTYMVKVVGKEGDATAILAVFDAVDTALHRSHTMELFEGVQIGCWRDEEISYVESTKQGVWLHYGGMFTVDVMD